MRACALVPGRLVPDVERMEIVTSTNEPVRLSFLLIFLRDAGFDPVVLDANMAAVEGSIGAIPRRIAVPTAQAPAARRALRDAGELEG